MSFQLTGRRVRRFFLSALAVLTFAAVLGNSLSFGQEGFDRKVRSKVSPSYPEIARKMGLAGSVKIAVTVAPNGTVKDTKVIGGHPILVTAAVDAVKKWKFETASSESTGTIEFRFDPAN